MSLTTYAEINSFTSWVIRDRPRLSRVVEVTTYRSLFKNSEIYHIFLSPLFFPASSQDYRGRLDLLTLTVIELLNDNRKASQELVSILEIIAPLDVVLARALKRGVRLFSAGDYLQSAYILGLQSENLLRFIAWRYNHSPYETTRHGKTLRPLGRTLLLLSDHVPLSILSYTRWVLKDHSGLNVRNLAAHGLLTQTNTYPQLSVAIIHLVYLYLDLIKSEEPAKVAGSSSGLLRKK